MTTTCPHGHRSQTTDYCDQCGTPLDGLAAPADGGSEVSSATQVRVAAGARDEACPQCGTPRNAGDRYCEVDGYDFDDPQLPGSVWIAEVTADRALFDRLAPDDLVFPTDAPMIAFPLESESVLVGRSSSARAIFPDIDLGGDFEDPGVSRAHLRLERAADGSYAVVDCDSANGTTLNDDPGAISPRTPVPLADGDRVHLGAWTTITIRRQPAGASTG